MTTQWRCMTVGVHRLSVPGEERRHTAPMPEAVSGTAWHRRSLEVSLHRHVVKEIDRTGDVATLKRASHGVLAARGAPWVHLMLLRQSLCKNSAENSWAPPS